MLIPSDDAEHFLKVYKEAMNQVTPIEGKEVAGLADVRGALYQGKYLKHPPTDDPDLLAALKTAVHGEFVVGRHRAKYTELIGKDNQVYRVQGITTELDEIMPPWVLVKTTVMQFRGHWISDGLFVGGNILLGRNMIREYTELIRDAPTLESTPAKPKSKAKTKKAIVKPKHVKRVAKASAAPPKKDKEREERISTEIVVDAYDGSERAMGWYYYLDDKLGFPFRARCVAKRSISPLEKGEEVEVSAMAEAEDCESEMFVLVIWKGKKLGVPLGQLEVIGEVEEKTREAVEDWHYWKAQGYSF